MPEVIGIVLYDKKAEDLAQWVLDDILKDKMRDRISSFIHTPVMECSETEASHEKGGGGSSPPHTIADSYAYPASKAVESHIVHAVEGMKSEGTPRFFVFLLIAIFWNGQCDTSKAAFTRLRQIAEKDSERYKALLHRIQERISPTTTAIPSRAREQEVSFEILVQALNAKAGDHAIYKNSAALVQSIERKLSSSRWFVAEKTPEAGGRGDQKSTVYRDPVNLHSSDSHLTKAVSPPAPTSVLLGEGDISPDAIDVKVLKGQGECFFTVCAESPEAFTARVNDLRENARKVHVSCTPILAAPHEVPLDNSSSLATASSADPGKVKAIAQEFLLRRNRPGEGMPEMRLALCGNVDSGKSTLTAVLTRGCQDDGRGFARSFVFKHKHEATTGRTSCISENYIGFSSTGEVVNYQSAKQGGRIPEAFHGPDSARSPAPLITVENETRNENVNGAKTETSKVEKEDVAGHQAALAAAVARQYTPQELSLRSCKMLTLYDLAGHTKYLKTTVLGLTRNAPDYACVVISANNGIQRMTKEHLALCLALKLPFFIVVTRIDSTPANILSETMLNINRLLKIPSVRKIPYPIRSPDELVLAAKNLRNDRITPIFEVSNVTGVGIPRLLQFLNILPLRKDWEEARRMPREMIVDNIFSTCVGTVVGGVVTQGIFHANDNVLLGPNPSGNYQLVGIKSIHVLGVDSPSASAGQDAAFCLKKVKRASIRKGNILAEPQPPPKAFWQFEADIVVLYHSTTITTGYEPMIHSPTVRQSAKVTYVMQEVLRTGDRSLVRFHFLYRPEFMKEGQRLIMREGNTKGIGVITRVIEKPDEQILLRVRPKKRQGRFGPGVPSATVPTGNAREESTNKLLRKK